MAADAQLWVYLPYADEQAAGMQRFGAHMVAALRDSGVEFELIVGEVHGRPAWLEGTRHRVAIGGRLARLLPRPLAAFARLLWLQTLFPFIAGRGSRLLALAHEMPPLPRVAQVAVAHDLTDFKAYAQRGSLATRVRNLLWRQGLERSYRVIAISEATKRDLLDVFRLDPGQVKVIYEGVDNALFNPAAARAGDGPKQPFLLYAGTLDPHKNVPFLLQVFAELRQEGPDVALKLVGRHDPKRVAALLQEVPEAVRQHVHFIGFVSDETLATMMAQCSAFLFPSRNEGFGLAPVEAMACGAPVIAADAGSLPEVIASGGLLLSPDDCAAWLEAIRRVLADDDYRRQLSAQALERSRAFSWDQAANAYRALLGNSLPGEPRR